MRDKTETPVILRQTRDGQIIALLPTIAVNGLETSIVAYSVNFGWFTTDVSIMHSTSSTEGSNIWPTLAKLINQENIVPVRVYKRMRDWMHDIRLKSNYSVYKAVA